MGSFEYNEKLWVSISKLDQGKFEYNGNCGSVLANSIKGSLNTVETGVSISKLDQGKFEYNGNCGSVLANSTKGSLNTMETVGQY